MSLVDRRQTVPTLERVAFKTSRLSEFCSQRELIAQTGHEPANWPLVVIKELVDNALDNVEATVAPEISVEVSTSRGEIVVSDNGLGLPSETIDGVLDYAVRVSSNEAYVSPSRGQQGYGVKSILAMPFCLDGTRGVTVIEAQGQMHRIVFEMDRVRREPRILRETGPSLVKTGTKITVHWPETACRLLKAAEPRFLQVIAAFTAFNPHLSLRWRWDDSEGFHEATNAAWGKWHTSRFTSAHWYDVERFDRYLGAHIAHDEDKGLPGESVREFIGNLAGLHGTGKQKQVLEAASASRQSLASFHARGLEAVAALLCACQKQTKPIKPEALGIIGEEHLWRYCVSNGAAEASFQYRRHLGTRTDRVPYVIEAAFAIRPTVIGEQDTADDQETPRRLITAGMNFSPVIGSPFERLTAFESLRGVLGRHHVNVADPVIVVLHYTCPRVDFADRGKGTLALPWDVARTIIGMIETLTKQWDKQQRAKIRSEEAGARQLEKLLKERQRPPKQAHPSPSGVLAEKLIAEAEQSGFPIDELTVLSRDRDPYTAWRRRPAAEWFAGLFNRFVAPDAKKHLRGLFYLLVTTTGLSGPTGQLFVNDHKNWVMVLKAASAARWLGLIRFDQVIDERNAKSEVYVPGVTPISTGVGAGVSCTIPDSAEDALPSCYINGFRGRQTHRLIFYGEKSSLSVVLRPLAELLQVDMTLVTGESSDTRLYEALQRAAEDGRPAVLFYFADFDPSGHQMIISVSRKVQAFRDLDFPNLNIKLYRVALTIDQVRELDLPSSPLKETEKRAARWRETFGHEQTEIDAMVELRPEVLRQAVFDAVRPFYDDTLDERVAAAEESWQEEAASALREHPDYGNLSAEVETAWQRAQAAVDELREAQDRAAEMLQENLPDPPELPEAAPTGEPKLALFDSERDFVTSTRRLIADKRLDEDQDDGDDDAEEP
jgi:hypothetical protein